MTAPARLVTLTPSLVMVERERKQRREWWKERESRGEKVRESCKGKKEGEGEAVPSLPCSVVVIVAIGSPERRIEVRERDTKEIEREDGRSSWSPPCSVLPSSSCSSVLWDQVVRKMEKGSWKSKKTEKTEIWSNKPQV
ncbi:hypothetical protein PIB30_055864 [Stylosanthes scabra]|uniref:Uncharacterized protein n=1 Tax=Stylosanthes scabra TaxID=79078 RepID=A0ABU6TJ11_9FABA|nr:hypothetical protein [Stylosanthes scabra]